MDDLKNEISTQTICEEFKLETLQSLLSTGWYQELLSTQSN